MHILIIKDKDSVQNMDTNTIYTTFIVPFFIVIYSVVLSEFWPLCLFTEGQQTAWYGENWEKILQHGKQRPLNLITLTITPDLSALHAQVLGVIN